MRALTFCNFCEAPRRLPAVQARRRFFDFRLFTQIAHQRLKDNLRIVLRDALPSLSALPAARFPRQTPARTTLPLHIVRHAAKTEASFVGRLNAKAA